MVEHSLAIVYTQPCRRLGCVSLKLLRHPDVKGRAILKGAAPTIVGAAALTISLPFTSGCLSSSKQPQYCSEHGPHGIKESSGTVHPITKPLLLQPIGQSLVIAPTD